MAQIIIRPDKAFDHIEEIIQGLYGRPFEPQTQARVNLLYQSFRAEYQAAQDCYQQEAVLVSGSG